MIDQRKRIFAVNIWLLDLTLTTASFFLAYGFRLPFELEGHTVMAVRVYVRLLAIILPIWAVLLPLFRVYSELTLPLDARDHAGALHERFAILHEQQFGYRSDTEAVETMNVPTRAALAPGVLVVGMIVSAISSSFA